MCEIPIDLWAEFRRHRKLLKKPMTPYAEKLILAKLARFEAEGHDPVAILNTSIENGWRGVFAPQAAAASPKAALPAKPPCSHIACEQPSILSKKIGTGWMNLCMVHYLGLDKIKAHEWKQ